MLLWPWLKLTKYADESISLRVNTTLLEKSGEWVNVTWSGVHFPAKSDWLGVWVLPNSSVSIDARKRAPIKFQVKFSSSH